MEEPRIENWDLFISHASEDKRTFVSPLARALSAFGVNVWYDDYELKLGDSLSRSIDAGLAKSSFGLVVLSPAFISKRWPEYELRGLSSREMLGQKVILPVWHDVGLKDVIAFSPTLADKLAIKADTLTPVEVAVEIIKAIRPDIFTQIQRRLAFRLAQRAAETKTSKVSELRPGPIQHPNLSDDMIGRIRLIRACLLGAYTHSMDFWVDGFKRDSHPSMEVSHWEHIAAVYREYVSMAAVDMSAKQHEAVYRFIFGLGLSVDKAKLSELANDLPEGAEEIITNLYRYPEPFYDIEEELPHAADEYSSDVLRAFSQMDKEHFPRDLPEELIRELLSISHDRTK
jgi:hypothetical protein